MRNNFEQDFEYIRKPREILLQEIFGNLNTNKKVFTVKLFLI